MKRRRALIRRGIPMLVALLSAAACRSVWAQAPTPTPTGESRCSAGSHDGLACNGDADCASGGVCVLVVGVCDGGGDDGYGCDCIAGSCMASNPVCDPSYTGVCQGGLNAAFCCDASTNCSGGVPCAGTPQVCVGGDDKGYACLRDAQCPGSVCTSTGTVCRGGIFSGYACVDDADCAAVGSSGGTCTGTAPVPTPTLAVAACTGDCDGSGDVVISELLSMVNSALGMPQMPACPIGDADGSGDITVNEIVAAVNNALNGCVVTPDGEFLCSGGPHDGEPCSRYDGCAPGGVCVIGIGLCDGGLDDGNFCDCIAGSCSPATPTCDPLLTGVCQGGVNADECCDVSTSCADGAPCVGAQKQCLGGDYERVSCLHDDQCPGSVCRSTAKLCNGGDFSYYSCIDDSDCLNEDGSPGGTCDAARLSTPASLSADSAAACVLTDQSTAVPAVQP